MFYLIADGQIIGTANTSEGLPCEWVEADLGPDTHALYLDSGVVKRKPDRPSDLHTWDSDFLEWRAVDSATSALTQNGPDWDGLISDLRGSAIWVKVFQAASTNLAANAAWTLIQSTLTSTRHIEDLQFGISQLRSGMDTDFTKTEVKALNKIFSDRNFAIVLA